MTKAHKSKPSEQAQQPQTNNHRRTIPELLLELVDKCEVWSNETRSKLWGRTPPYDSTSEGDEEERVSLWHSFLEATNEPWTEAHERLFCEHPGAAKELQSRYMDIVNFLQNPPYPSDPPKNIATLAIIPLSGLTSLSRNVAKELEAQVTLGTLRQTDKTDSGTRERVTKPTYEHAQPQGRPRKHTEAKCRKALKQFTEFYAESNDATGAWNKVADNLDFESGEAARKACERYRQAQNTGQNGQN